jgi:hypothetical protein
VKTDEFAYQQHPPIQRYISVLMNLFLKNGSRRVLKWRS